ncbi:MAG: HRDC domain-containing protein [Methylococcales bacterium]|nr:HRDC domain-containing protein [Methylococcales bacterium]
MKYRFFNINAQNPESGQEDLNTHCVQHRIVAVEKQFVAQGDNSFWSICVTSLDSAEKPNPTSNKRAAIDYREILNEQDFAMYAELRNLRKTLAEQEGVPAYALFTNEQLAEMVTRRTLTQSELAGIEGVGKARLEKYGATFINLLKTTLAKS